MEKTIYEWRVVETDDGFRIEVKGDKRALRGWLKHGWHHGPRHWARHMRFGPWAAGFAGRRPWWGFEEEHSGEEPEA